MNDFWKDYSDYVVFIPSILIGGLISYWIFLKQKQIKKIGFEIVGKYNIVEIEKNFKDKVEVLFNGVKVDNLWLLTLKITNNGNIPIEKKDFDKPIYISLNSTSKLVHQEIEKTIPENLPIVVSETINSITIEPCLLNPSDSCSFRFLVTGDTPEPKVDARISGIKEVENLTKTTSKGEDNVVWSKLLLSLLGGLFSIIVSFISLTEIKDFFIEPRLGFVSNNVVVDKSKNENITLTMTSASSTARDKKVIYYYLNQEHEIKQAQNIESIWNIDLTNSRDRLLEGRNVICFKFSIDQDAYHCEDFFVKFVGAESKNIKDK